MGIKSWMYRFCFKKTVDVSQAEIEQITTELIEETRNILQKRFDEVMSKQSGSMTEDQAQVILHGLIKEAISKRKLLSGRIEKSVETGTLFDRYYSKMQTINSLTNSAFAQMQKMNVSKAKYEFQCGIYKKLTGKMYIPDTIPDDRNPVKSEDEQYKDIWETMEEEKKIFQEEL
jgi:hypothetical protein